MGTDFLGIKESEMEPHAGAILIAEPFSLDSFFGRSVVLLTEHSEMGSVGFVLNKFIDIPLHELLDDFPEFSGKVGMGGPVSSNIIHYIHTLGDIIPESVRIYDQLYWGGDFEAVKQVLKSKKVNKKNIRFFFRLFWLVARTIGRGNAKQILDCCQNRLS